MTTGQWGRVTQGDTRHAADADDVDRRRLFKGDGADVHASAMNVLQVMWDLLPPIAAGSPVPDVAGNYRMLTANMAHVLFRSNTPIAAGALAQ